ncbi:hypothetical protein CU254_42010 (plasmid) [Amycolatopsis sp. AA4]|uniref:hypothetical protein n=1 Tax=Actinomycetes TaxID=1760 RepID=UPI0001B56C14|nr:MULTISPECIES: hypothetical protein [Actinomycetes]ATY17155.1 hypothetical protein CU254_42010 [Amycolatopsis sp. AA4]
MTASDESDALEAARAAGRAEAEAFFAERDRLRATRLETLLALCREGEDARVRLATRYGNDDEKRWVATPDGPQVDPVSLLHAFLAKAWGSRNGPELERADALAAAHVIRLARDAARNLEANTMRQIVRQGVSWEELAYALDTTPKELREQLRQPGAAPETPIPPAGGPGRDGGNG